VRQEIVGVIKASGEAGIGKLKSCELLQIHIRRIERWESRLKSTGTLQYGKSGPKQALHAIVPAEREAVLCFARRETTVDYSFQMLSIRGAEQGLFFMSASSVRHILQEYGLGDDRSGRRRGTKGLKPNRPEELTGPNQCWCWDISYLRTDIRRVFWYLYVLLDEWSRKVIAWRVSHTLSHEEAMGLIDDGIIAEKLLDVPQEQRPVVVNDHGSQMKAKPVKQMFVDLGIEQTFARCKTPNDNPFIEALFSTVKTSPAYPGWFPSGNPGPVREYFTRFYNWYDNEHYHSRIGYITPMQKHTGQAERILTERKKQLTARRQERTKYWLSQPLTGSGP
jgi:putative transposase